MMSYENYARFTGKWKKENILGWKNVVLITSEAKRNRGTKYLRYVISQLKRHSVRI